MTYTTVTTPPLQIALFVTLSFIGHWIVYWLTPISWFQPKSAAVKPDESVNNGKKSDATELRKRHNVIRNYFVSTIHATNGVVGILIWLQFFTFDLWDPKRTLEGGVVGTGDEYMPYLVCISVGYFIYDLMCMLIYKETFSVGSLLHHVFIGAAFILGLITNVGRPYHFIFLIEEFSTPFLNAKTLYKYNEKVSTIYAMLFALTFFLVRIVVGTYTSATVYYTVYSYVTTSSNTLNSMLAIIQISLFSTSRVLNYYWMALIVKKVMGASKKKDDTKKKA